MPEPQCVVSFGRVSYPPTLRQNTVVRANQTGGAMGGIFICYRRRDTAWAGRLSDSLKSDLGRLNIFRDIENIPPGVEFDKYITEAVSGCDALVAIIGPDWLSATDKFGKRRLDNPNDLVRLEIAAALKRNVRLIPILVSGGTMPEPEELPADLQQFARRQAYELTDAHWAEDCRRLFGVLRPLVSQESKLRRYRAALFGVLVAAAAVGGYAWIVTKHDIAIHNDPAQIATVEEIRFDEKAAAEKAAAEKAAAEKAAAEKAAAEKAAAEKAAAEKAAAEKAAAEKAAVEKAAAEKPLPRKPPPRKPLPRKPLPRKPLPRKPLPRKPLPRKPLPRKPLRTKPLPRKPLPRKPLPRKPLPRKPPPRKPLPRKPLRTKP